MNAGREELRGELLRVHQVHQVQIVRQASSSAECLDSVSFEFVDAGGYSLGDIDVSDGDNLLYVGSYLLGLQEVSDDLTTLAVNWDLESDLVSVTPESLRCIPGPGLSPEP